jgi:hypothetical protein
MKDKDSNGVAKGSYILPTGKNFLPHNLITVPGAFEEGGTNFIQILSGWNPPSMPTGPYREHGYDNAKETADRPNRSVFDSLRKPASLIY